MKKLLLLIGILLISKPLNAGITLQGTINSGVIIGGVAPTGDSLLLESGDFLLLESGDKLLLE